METYNYIFSIIDDFINKKVNVKKLQEEIQTSTIITSLYSINVENQNCIIIFKAQLSTDDETILQNMVSVHDGEPYTYQEPQKVRIIEESNSNGEQKTQGQYKAMSINVDISGGTGIYTKEISFPYYVSIASAQWFCNTENIGDESSFYLAPDTIIGVNVSEVLSGTNELYVSPTVIQNIYMGYNVKIGDEELGTVIEIDSINYKIKTEFNAINTYPIGSYISMTIRLVDKFVFSGLGIIQIGTAKIGTSLIPPNVSMKVVYNNKSGIAKKFSFFMDYSY